MNQVEGRGEQETDDEEQRMKEEFINNIVKEFSVVTEDDDMGKLANKLGPADLTGIPQLIDKTIKPFITEHSRAVLAFYQKCEYAKI